MVKVVWTARSLSDIDQIAEYISKDSIHYATGVVKRILAIEDHIAKNGNAGRVVPEFNKNNLREVFEGNYRIVYRIVSSNEIQIITVCHMARRLVKKYLPE